MTKFGIEKTLAQNATKLSDGNLNKALKICKDGDKNYSQDFIDWMRLCWSADYGGLMKWGEEIAKAGRENQKNFFIYGIRLMRECLLMNKNLNSLNRLLPQEKDFAIKFSPFIGEHNITQITELMTNGHYYIERNAQAKLLFFNISLWMNEELRKKQPSLL
ncbi:MAG: hypothetical protein NTX03_13005, partial [Bacteroidetes bacterium]|nr:hypothetical protein [Bacteroidota bacterium]